ncbi:helix-turn-helix domain-containing protein [Cohnella massiliensis]|uniref:helix-turn-helix domain-containing protein n=1 Tax=Cohnella massiliensis TaxID=1816691 RepID=UPI00159436E4|nr:helix-turn-helix transcriptional regulator [Cohnella massiliensis]
MAVGEAIREARDKRDMTQDEVGQIGFISNKMVSAIERGTRPASADALKRMVTALDYHRLYIEAAAEVTGGVYASPWLDGESVDLHRTSVWAKMQEELEEALESAEEANIIDIPISLAEAERQEIYGSIMQALDARVAIDHYVGIICEEYKFSLLDVYREHRRKLESRGYVKGKRKSAAATTL